MNSNIKDFFFLLGIILSLIIAFKLGKDSAYTTLSSTDTIHINKPEPNKVETVETKYVYLPSEPSPPDTVYIDREIRVVDSVKVAIDIERKTYQDSTFKAIISGPRIGDYGPILDDINIYSKIETKIIEKPYPFLVPYISFEGGKDVLGIGGGVTIKQRVDVGAKCLRIKEQNMFLIEANIRFNK